MRPKRDKTRDAVDRPSLRSSLSGNPGARYFSEKNRAKHKKDESEQERLVSQEQLRDETMTKKETKQC